MYPVTYAYNEAMKKQVRNTSWVQISFGVVDPDAPAAATLVDNGHESYSNVQGTSVGATAAVTYATLEHNRWILDGRNPIPAESNPIYQGYIGNIISDSDNRYLNGTNSTVLLPTVTCTFSDYFEFPALSFYFDESTNDYPGQFRVQAYNGSNLVHDKTDTVREAYHVHGSQIPMCNKLVFTWQSSHIPYRRARLTSILFGLLDEIDTTQLESCSCDSEIDLLSTAFPRNDFNFTILDTKRSYDPENPDGVWSYLESRQPVDVKIGYSLDDSDIEWLPWCHTYSTGEFSVSGSEAVTKVTVKTCGILEHMTQVYDESKYIPAGRSLYDLAYDVVNYIGYASVIEVDESLKKIKTTVPLPSDQANNVLQLIANAGQCVMGYTRGGVLRIMKDTNTVSNFTMDFYKMTDRPETNKVPPLRNVVMNYHIPRVTTEVRDIIKDQYIEVIGDAMQNITFAHGCYTEQTVSVSSGLTAGTPILYAYKTVVPLKGKGTITIRGKSIEFDDVEYKKNYRDVGEDLTTMDNPLIDSYANMVPYCDWVAGVVMRRNSYEVPDRGYPEIDCMDTIHFTSNFLSDITVEVTATNVTFNGTISGDGKYIIVSEGGK